jgi:hypothetical protein
MRPAPLGANAHSHTTAMPASHLRLTLRKVWQTAAACSLAIAAATAW